MSLPPLPRRTDDAVVVAVVQRGHRFVDGYGYAWPDWESLSGFYNARAAKVLYRLEPDPDTPYWRVTVRPLHRWAVPGHVASYHRFAAVARLRAWWLNRRLRRHGYTASAAPPLRRP